MGHSSLTPFPTCAGMRGMLSENIFLALAIGAQCHISVSEQDDVTVQVFFFPPFFFEMMEPGNMSVTAKRSHRNPLHWRRGWSQTRLPPRMERMAGGGSPFQRLCMSSAGSSGTDSKAPIVHIWDIVRWRESKLNFVLHRTLSWRSGAPLTANQVAVPLVHDSKLYLTGDGDWTWSAPGSDLIRTALIDLQDPPLRIRGRPGVVFIYCSELHGSSLSLSFACSVFRPGWPWARPRLRPHLDAIPPLKPMPKYPFRYSSASGKRGGF